MSVKKEIEKKIRYAQKGKMYIMSDFSNLGEYNNIKINIQNLVKEGKLQKIYTGIYMKPNYAEFLKIDLPPNIYDLIQTYARKFNWTITPSGNTAMNMLGLDTQVPAKINYISTGPTRTINIDGRQIHFRHKSLRDSNYSQPTALLIEGLKTFREKYGLEHIDDTILITINNRFTDEQMNKIEKEALTTRAWIRDLIKRMQVLRSREKNK
ncbi:MAG: DUF6088 family protein [Streptococcaceae bacterium]|jgi:hypothetical protein|nr:DUF6088 family protein [Streptococcaceae bacterium]